MPAARHLAWIPLGGAASFAASFVFGDLLPLPVDLYYLIYFCVVGCFLALYVHATDLDLRSILSRRLLPGLILGVVVGVLMAQNVFSRPATEHYAGWMLPWVLVWRGLLYGLADGLILFAFPWVVVWRALDGEGGPFARKIGAAGLAWVAVLLVTTVYHLGYGDFRSRKIIQPNVGSTLMSVPTLLAANPVASPVSHVFLHVSAVLHSPHTELFLPPHGE